MSGERRPIQTPFAQRIDNLTGGPLTVAIWSCAVFIVMGDQWSNHLRLGYFQDLTFASLIIAVYPIIIPTPPRLAFISSSLAGLTVPFGLFVLRYVGIPGDREDYIVAATMGVISATIASCIHTACSRQ